MRRQIILLRLFRILLVAQLLWAVYWFILHKDIPLPLIMAGVVTLIFVGILTKDVDHWLDRRR